MYTLKDLLDPNNPVGDRYNDYAQLVMVAYDLEPSTQQFQRFMECTEAEQNILIRLVADAIDQNVLLQLECMGLNVPEWMMAGAPNAETHERWMVAGLLNGQI